MRITTALLFLLPGLLALPRQAGAQAPYFTALDQGPEWGAPLLIDVSAGADGNLSILEKGMPDPELGGPFAVVVTGYSLEDGVLWRKRFDPVEFSANQNPVSITRLANGETLVLGLVPVGGELEDYFLMRLDVDGNQVGTTTFHLDDQAVDFYYGYSYVHELADGSVVFTMGMAIEPVFVRWSGGPTVDWARSFKPTTEEPLVKCPAYDFAVLPDGDLLLSLKPVANTSTMFLVRVDADGEVEWSRNYTGMHVKNCNAMALPNGDIAIVGRLGAFDPTVAKLDAQGDIQWVTQLTTANVDYGNGNGFDRVIQRSNGDLLVSVSNYVGPANSGLIRLNSAGQPLEAWSLQEELMGKMGLVEQHGDAVIMAGQATMTVEDAPHRVIPVARFDPLTVQYCQFEADAITSEAIAFSNASTSGHTVHDRLVSLGTMEWVETDLAAPFLATCSVHTGLPEGAASTLPVLPSLVDRGGEIFIQLPASKGSCTVEVLDMAGRVVMRSRPNGLDRVALTMDVEPGSYAVRIEHSGKPIASGRVIVR